jgi:hypothetical protein
MEAIAIRDKLLKLLKVTPFSSPPLKLVGN